MLQRQVARAARSTFGRSLRLAPTRGYKTLKDSPQYSAKATSQGSRANGVSKLDVSILYISSLQPRTLTCSLDIPGRHRERLFTPNASLCRPVIADWHNLQLELKMRLPKSLGGPGGEHNPEELFGMA